MTIQVGGRDSVAAPALRGRFRGALLHPGEEGYEDGRRVWNGAVDRRPALIARCTSAHDVALALGAARERGLPVAVRGGGHAVVGHGVCEGGVVLDLSPMKHVAVDPVARVARAAGGLLWSELDAATQQHGLAVTGGSVGHVGIGGLTLGGGFGHLMRRHGLTVDNLRAVDLVTADGERLRVDAERDPELFWGLRGGGGNFGVATAFEYDLHRVGPTVLGGPVFWPLHEAPEVLRALPGLVAGAPDELGIALVARLAPPLPALAPEHHGTPVLGLLLVWCGDLAAGERAVAPFTAVGRPVAAEVGPVAYRTLQSLIDRAAPHGRHYAWRSQKLPALPDAVVDAVMTSASTLTSPHSLLNGWVVGGAASRVDPGATALGPREAGFELRHIAAWEPGDPHGERHRAWVRDGWERLRPHSSGVYPGFLADEGPDGVRSAYGDRLPRLVALKDRLDPTNVFRLNANVPPSTEAAR